MPASSSFDNSRIAEILEASIARSELPGAPQTLPVEARLLVFIAFKVQYLVSLARILPRSIIREMEEDLNRSLAMISPDLFTPENRKLQDNLGKTLLADLRDLAK